MRILKWIVVLGIVLLAAQVNSQESQALKKQNVDMSYALGVEMARNFMRLGIQVEVESLVKGLRDSLSGEKLLMTEEELRTVLNTYRTHLKRERAQTMETVVEDSRTSYGIGVEMARNFMRQGIQVEVGSLVKGLRGSFSGEKLLMTEEELRAAMRTYQIDLRRKRTQAMKTAAEDNLRKGEAFLAANKEKEGVVTLPSGLQYKIIKAGDGKKPTEADMVEVHFRGNLIDGTEFDSSYRNGQPVSFKVVEVIPGWKEALKLMPVGSKWQVFIPSHLAYGAMGSSRKIGPNQTLIFEIELISFK